MIYLDTSALVAIYLPEAASDRAEAIVSAELPCAISDLSEVEFYSAISRRLRMKELKRSDALTVIDAFADDVKVQRFQLAHVETSHFRIARSLIARFDTPLRSLDALHVAIARDRGFQLLTLDKSLAKASRRLGLEVLTA